MIEHRRDTRLSAAQDFWNDEPLTSVTPRLSRDEVWTTSIFPTAIIPNADSEAQAVMFLGVDGQLAGLVDVADPIKPSTPAAIEGLHKEGLRVVMLAGDNQTTAEAVAERLGLDEVMADVLPDQKAEAVRRLQAEAGSSRWPVTGSTMRNIRQNLFFAFVYNAISVPVAAGILYPAFRILLSPMIAAVAMSLSSVSVIGNSLRLRRFQM